MKKKILPLLIALLVAVVCFLLFVRTMYRNQYISDMKKLNTCTDFIEGQLGNAFAYANMMEVFIRSSSGNYDKDSLDNLTQLAMEENTFIRNFQLAKNGVITYVNPQNGNEAELGIRLLDDEKQKKSVQEAIDSRTVVTQGPIETEQGTLQILARKAIWIDDEFWGLAIVSVDFENLLKKCGLTEESMDCDVAIAVYDSDDTLSYVWGDESYLDNYELMTTLKQPHQKWKIALHRSTTPRGLLRAYGLYLVASLFVGMAFYGILMYLLHRLHLAKSDQLTKTLNRHEFQKQVEKKLLHNHGLCALLAVDMDNFKEINDTYGHLAGDEALIATASRMRNVMRKSDLLSRVGGDEYMILLSDIRNEKQLIAVICRIREAVEKGISTKGNILYVSFSIGYALSPTEGTDYTKLYQIADERMYQNKLSRKGEPPVE